MKTKLDEYIESLNVKQWKGVCITIRITIKQSRWKQGFVWGNYVI